MLPGAATNPALRPSFPPPTLLAGAEREVRARRPRATVRDPLIEHDPSLLVTALADIRRQQAALEWLREADLFRACLG